jgi:hypothetical protein
MTSFFIRDRLAEEMDIVSLKEKGAEFLLDPFRFT